MKNTVDPYVLSFESESVRNKQKRHHWMICLAKKPAELVSWGHAPTHELAASASRNELKDPRQIVRVRCSHQNLRREGSQFGSRWERSKASSFCCPQDRED